MKRTSNVAALFLSATLVAAAASPALAQQQSNDQQRCLNALNKAGAKVAATQGKENSSCVKATGSSNLEVATTDLCVAADAKQKVAGAQQKTVDALATKCESPYPAFGYTSPAVINAAAEGEEVGLLSDVFGTVVDDAMIIGGDGAKCQANVTKTFEKLGATRMKAFNACKKTGLKEGGGITNATQLQACIESDPKQKVSGAATKLDDSVENSCDGVVLATAFPGCSAEAGTNLALSSCIERKVECRMCQLANAMDALDIPCDQADDGVVNQTCRQCGNSATEAPEFCDDGGDSATCDDDCTAASCGDTHVNAAASEACDDGTETVACDDDCTLPECTDGNVNETAGEVCDDGNDTNGDGCDNNCTVSACGNGIAAGGEECDDDNDTNGDGCDNNCTVTACGNGIVTAGETCDDDNLVDGDGCDSNCTPTGCNNNIVTGVEACDTGGETAGCDDDCTLPACHDGNHNAAAGEACDDGNVDDTDACVGACVLATCGDALLCSSVGCTTGPSGGVEECDDGGSNSDVLVDACRTTCATAFCGDNVIDTGETCDDGGNSPTCDADCTPWACGDGFINPAAGEDCDSSGESVSCDADCTTAVCGDSTINATAGELCDDGNAEGGDGCSAICLSGPGSGESDPLCPNLGELVLFSKTSNQVCATNAECTFPRTCHPDRLRCETVTDLDSGWNGAGHDSDINDQIRATARLVCEGPPSPGCGECEVAGVSPEAGNCRCANNVLTKCDEPFANDADDCGGALCECYFGAPFPLSAQGTPACISNTFSVDITGTANPDLGSGLINASLRTRVFLGHTTDMPCPVCGGKCSNDDSACIFDADCDGGATCVQDTPGDGIRDGECVRNPDFHTGDGVACDADGTNASFPGVIGDDTPGQGGGRYSIDCQPDVGKNISGDGLRIILTQTTGTTELDFGVDCDAGGMGTDLCPCKVCSTSQTEPCDSNADCEALAGSCSLAIHSGGVPCMVESDCTSANIGPCLGGVNKCSKRQSINCMNNSDCLNQNVGPCNLQTCTSNGSGEAPQPNFCVDDICTDQGGGEGECAAGPSFKYCDGLVTADGRGMNSCSTDAGCQVGGDYGTCTLLDPADCFMDPIVATGVEDTEFPVAGAVFCIPPTSNSGINSSAGLPGPGRVINQGAARTFCSNNNANEYTPGGVPACPP